MTISLTPELDDLVNAQIESGRFTTAQEVIVEGLRLLENRESARAKELVALNEMLQERLDSLDRGEFVDPDELRTEFKQMSAEHQRLVA